MHVRPSKKDSRHRSPHLGLQPFVCVSRRRTGGIAPLTSVDDLTSVDQLAALLPVGQLSKKELEAIQKSMRLQLLLLSLKELEAIQKSMRLVSHTWGRVEVCFCAVHYTCPSGSRCLILARWAVSVLRCVKAVRGPVLASSCVRLVSQKRSGRCGVCGSAFEYRALWACVGPGFGWSRALRSPRPAVCRCAPPA